MEGTIGWGWGGGGGGVVISSGDTDNGVRIGVGGFADGWMGLVFVAVAATLTRQLVDTQRIVDVVRIGADGVPVGQVGRR